LKFVEPPTITEIDPLMGPTSGGTPVSIFGVDFTCLQCNMTFNYSVKFGDRVVQGRTFISTVAITRAGHYSTQDDTINTVTPKSTENNSNMVDVSISLNG
jgi:hypothetical protein